MAKLLRAGIEWWKVLNSVNSDTFQILVTPINVFVGDDTTREVITDEVVSVPENMKQRNASGKTVVLMDILKTSGKVHSKLPQLFSQMYTRGEVLCIVVQDNNNTIT